VNKRVMEALIKVDALNSLGHPAQLMLALDEAMSYGQTQARDRATGQGSLFDMLAAEESPLEQKLPVTTEAPSRERLRWEKELLGLYLSDHPLGEISAEMGQYVNAWSADVAEPLDQQRVVVGGMAVGIRRVITRNKESMAVVTLEDLQGSVDVVVFPRTYTDVSPKLTDDAVLLIVGRVDHKGDETVILADAVWTWEEATDKGVERFTQEVAAGDRGRGRGRRRDGAARGAGRSNNGNGNGAVVAVPVAAAATPTETMIIPRVSPLRGSQPAGTMTISIGGPDPGSGGVQPAPPAPVGAQPATDMPAPIDLPDGPAEPLSGPSEPTTLAGLAPDGRDEPPLPDEARAAVASAATATTTPVEAGPTQVLHIRFAAAPDERIVDAFGELKALIKSHPGSTPIVLHIPAGAGRAQEMRLGVGIAYDAELVAEVSRRFGSLLQLQLV